MKGVKLYEFQEEAVDRITALSEPYKNQQVITVKSPTGSGKTIILLGFVDKYLNEIEPNTAFVWLCPGKGDLEMQSMRKMEKFLPSRTAYTLDDVLKNGFSAGSTTFINWELVTKKGNNAIKDSEKKNLFDRIAEAKREQREFIIIVDEEHSNKTAKAQYIIDKIDAKHIIRVSATAKPNKKYEYIEIDEQDVIDAGLITKAIYVNEGVTNEQDRADDYAELLILADKKRKEIQQRYRSIGSSVRPLVLIQFPSGHPETIEGVERNLEEMGYTYDNHMVSIWMSGKKIDLPDNLTENDAEPVFLLMKQAISTGWDCPRAEVIYSMRPHSDYTYISQLIGRMVRTPLARRVDIDTLNSVSCFLPYFDPKTVQKVVDRLTKDGGEEDGSGTGDSGRKVIVNPVTVQWDADLGVDESFESIMSRKRSAEKRNYIKGLLDYTGLLLKYEVDLDAEDYVMDKLLRELNDSIITYSDEFAAAKAALSKIESTDVTFRLFDEHSVATNTRTDTADSYAIRHAREKADSSFELALTNKYFAQEHSKGVSNRDANIAIAAAASVPAITTAVAEKAKALLDEFQHIIFGQQIDMLERDQTTQLSNRRIQ